MTDTFRKEYKKLKKENSDLILKIKNKAEEIEVLFNTISTREMSIAQTNLETAIMWSTKAIVLNEDNK